MTKWIGREGYHLSNLASRTKTVRRKNRKKRSFLSSLLRLFMLVAGVLILVCGAAAAWLFYTPSGTEYRYVIADTIITSQHRVWAKYLIGQVELDKRVAAYQQSFEDMGDETDHHNIVRPQQTAPETAENLVKIEPISGNSFKGYLMTVTDPTKIRLGVPYVAGKGEKVTSMVKRYGAIAGVNAGGFADPNWKGNGFQPIGVVISQGKILYKDLDKSNSTQIVGIDKLGKMIAGRYTLKELEDLNIQEAVTFQPRIIVNGKGLVRDHKDGWGIAPRTAMAQTADGTIMFLVLDGRRQAIASELICTMCRKFCLSGERSSLRI